MNKETKFKLVGDIESPKESQYLVDQLKDKLQVFKIWIIALIAVSILACVASFAIFFQKTEIEKQLKVATDKTQLAEIYISQNDSLHNLIDSISQLNLLLQSDNDLLVENSDRMDGIFFEVLVGGFEDFNIDRYLSDLAKIRNEPYNGSNHIVVARFRSFKKALLFENDLKRIGVKDIKIVGLVDGKVVAFKEALEAAQNQK